MINWLSRLGCGEDHAVQQVHSPHTQSQEGPNARTTANAAEMVAVPGSSDESERSTAPGLPKVQQFNRNSENRAPLASFSQRVCDVYPRSEVSGSPKQGDGYGPQWHHNCGARYGRSPVRQSIQFPTGYRPALPMATRSLYPGGYPVTPGHFYQASESVSGQCPYECWMDPADVDAAEQDDPSWAMNIMPNQFPRAARLRKELQERRHAEAAARSRRQAIESKASSRPLEVTHLPPQPVNPALSDVLGRQAREQHMALAQDFCSIVPTQSGVADLRTTSSKAESEFVMLADPTQSGIAAVHSLSGLPSVTYPNEGVGTALAAGSGGCPPSERAAEYPPAAVNVSKHPTPGRRGVSGGSRSPPRQQLLIVEPPVGDAGGATIVYDQSATYPGCLEPAVLPMPPLDPPRRTHPNLRAAQMAAFDKEPVEPLEKSAAAEPDSEPGDTYHKAPRISLPAPGIPEARPMHQFRSQQASQSLDETPVADSVPRPLHGSTSAAVPGSADVLRSVPSNSATAGTHDLVPISNIQMPLEMPGEPEASNLMSAMSNSSSSQGLHEPSYRRQPQQFLQGPSGCSNPSHSNVSRSSGCTQPNPAEGADYTGLPSSCICPACRAAQNPVLPIHAQVVHDYQPPTVPPPPLRPQTVQLPSNPQDQRALHSLLPGTQPIVSEPPTGNSWQTEPFSGPEPTVITGGPIRVTATDEAVTHEIDPALMMFRMEASGPLPPQSKKEDKSRTTTCDSEEAATEPSTTAPNEPERFKQGQDQAVQHAPSNQKDTKVMDSSPARKMSEGFKARVKAWEERSSLSNRQPPAPMALEGRVSSSPLRPPSEAQRMARKDTPSRVASSTDGATEGKVYESSPIKSNADFVSERPTFDRRGQSTNPKEWERSRQSSIRDSPSVSKAALSERVSKNQIIHESAAAPTDSGPGAVQVPSTHYFKVTVNNYKGGRASTPQRPRTHSRTREQRRSSQGIMSARNCADGSPGGWPPSAPVVYCHQCPINLTQTSPSFVQPVIPPLDVPIADQQRRPGTAPLPGATGERPGAAAGSGGPAAPSGDQDPDPAADRPSPEGSVPRFASTQVPGSSSVMCTHKPSPSNSVRIVADGTTGTLAASTSIAPSEMHLPQKDLSTNEATRPIDQARSGTSWLGLEGSEESMPSQARIPNPILPPLSGSQETAAPTPPATAAQMTPGATRNGSLSGKQTGDPDDGSSEPTVITGSHPENECTPATELGKQALLTDVMNGNFEGLESGVHLISTKGPRKRSRQQYDSDSEEGKSGCGKSTTKSSKKIGGENAPPNVEQKGPNAKEQFKSTTLTHPRDVQPQSPIDSKLVILEDPPPTVEMPAGQADNQLRVTETGTVGTEQSERTQVVNAENQHDRIEDSRVESQEAAGGDIATARTTDCKHDQGLPPVPEGESPQEDNRSEEDGARTPSPERGDNALEIDDDDMEPSPFPGVTISPEPTRVEEAAEKTDKPATGSSDGKPSREKKSEEIDEDEKENVPRRAAEASKTNSGAPNPPGVTGINRPEGDVSPKVVSPKSGFSRPSSPLLVLAGRQCDNSNSQEGKSERPAATNNQPGSGAWTTAAATAPSVSTDEAAFPGLPQGVDDDVGNDDSSPSVSSTKSIPLMVMRHCCPPTANSLIVAAGGEDGGGVERTESWLPAEITGGQASHQVVGRSIGRNHLFAARGCFKGHLKGAEPSFAIGAIRRRASMPCISDRHAVDTEFLKTMEELNQQSSMIFKVEQVKNHIFAIISPPLSTSGTTTDVSCAHQTLSRIPTTASQTSTGEGPNARQRSPMDPADFSRATSVCSEWSVADGANSVGSAAAVGLRRGSLLQSLEEGQTTVDGRGRRHRLGGMAEVHDRVKSLPPRVFCYVKTEALSGEVHVSVLKRQEVVEQLGRCALFKWLTPCNRYHILQRPLRTRIGQKPTTAKGRISGRQSLPQGGEAPWRQGKLEKVHAFHRFCLEQHRPLQHGSSTIAEHSSR